MIYLASPYTHLDFTIMTQRFEATEAFVARAIARERPIFSPIVHCHALAQKFDMPPEFKFWKNYNLAMLKAASELWILKLEGWNKSEGVQGEIAYATEHKIWTIHVTENYFPCK